MRVRLCLLSLLVSAASAHADTKLILTGQSSAPTCPGSAVCLYALTGAGVAYQKGPGVPSPIRVGDALVFRSSANCSALGSPANGDVCFDTTLGYFRYYSTGWWTMVKTVSFPLSQSGQTLSIAPSGIVYAVPTGADKGVLPASSTHYLVAPGQAATGTTEAVLLVAPRAGTARQLYCYLGTAPGGADNIVITARKNSADQALTCTIAAAATNCSDATNSFAVAAGDRLSVGSANSATSTAADLTCSFEVTN